MRRRIFPVTPAYSLCTGPVLAIAAPASADDHAPDSCLDIGLAQLMQATLTSAAKKEQSLNKTAAAAFVITRKSQDTLGNSLSLCQSITGIAKSFDLKVVAEGVETQYQRATLGTMACDALQGFLLSRPVPSDQVTSHQKELQTGFRAEPVAHTGRPPSPPTPGVSLPIIAKNPGIT